MILFLVALIPYFLIRIKNGKNKVLEVLLAAGYVAGSEVFLRMTKAYYLYETGKYLVMFFILVGLINSGFKRKAYPYIIFLLLLIPAVMVSFENISYDIDFRKTVLFNISGPLCLSFVAIYTYGKSLSYSDFLKVLNFVVYPIISMTIYIILYNPDLRDVITNTAANAAASGGYGPNQVSTALGLGIFILFSRLFIPYKTKLVNYLMMALLAVMTLRGILTFSRGGILTGVVMISIFTVFFFSFTNLKSKLKTGIKLIGVVGAIGLIWTLSLLQTGGLIENRYTNKDSLGREKVDISSGREQIIVTELEAFFENPFLGVGIGIMKYVRLEKTGIKAATHNEISRMLSEHGLFGIFALLILIIVPIINNPFGIKNIYFYPLLLFWLLTISHSSMRIAAPAFIYGLGLITIIHEKKDSVHRK